MINKSDKILFIKIKLLLILLCNCNNNKSSYDIHLPYNHKVVSINSVSFDSVIIDQEITYRSISNDTYGKIGSVLVDSNRRVFIADLQNMMIDVFDENGYHISKLGRKGRGPNEFTYIKSLRAFGNQLYAFDSKQSIINKYDIDQLRPSGTIALARNRNEYPSLKGAFPEIHDFFVIGDNSYLAMFRFSNNRNKSKWENFTFTVTLMKLDDKGDIIENDILTYILATGTQIGTAFNSALIGYHLNEIFGERLVAVHQNKIYMADPDEFVIKIYNLKGDYQRALYFPFDKILLTEESAIRANLPPLYQNNWENIDRPSTWPTIVKMFIDDKSRIWIAKLTDNPDFYNWLILKPSGDIVSSFEWPIKKSIQQVVGNYLYTIEQNTDGYDVVIRYSFLLK